MALVTATTELAHHVVGFTGRGFQVTTAAFHQGAWASYPNSGAGVEPLAISPEQRLDVVARSIEGLPMGPTDCSLPMLYAAQRKLEVDVFVVYTDSETWFGEVHPFQALAQYRQKTGIPAKLVVVGMVANEFTIADPSDAGMLDVVGFDTAAPAVMADFARQ
jgi:60 kDa SS-A/Ro ribonucleoprotein